jgi:uncharacterized protein (DUF433 family)
MNSVITYPHIVVDEKGAARIGQTRCKVLHLAGEHYHYGWSGEELLRQHPDLRPEEVYAALTYFYDHYQELVDEMQRQAAATEAMRASQPLSRAEFFVPLR